MSPQPRRGDGARRAPARRTKAGGSPLARVAGGGAVRRLGPLAALAAAAAGAVIARRRSGGPATPPAPPFEATPTAPDPAVRAAAAQATPPGPPPAAAPEPGSAAEAALATPPAGADAADGPAVTSPDSAAPPVPEPSADAEAHTIGLYVLHQGPRADRARTALAEALAGDATLGEPDDVGRFDAQVTADSPAAAEQRVRAAFAASGTGDDFTIVTGTQGREIPADDPRQPER